MRLLDGFVLLSTIAYILVGLVVGVRLLRLSRRTGGFPELALGLAECTLCGAVPPLFLLAQLLPGPDLLVRAASLGGNLAIAIGYSVMILFTWRVFRAREAWARWLAIGAIAAVAVCGVAGMGRAFAAEGIEELRSLDSTAFRLMSMISVASYVWGAAEAFAYHRQLTKRLALGLSDPVVVNRVLLWALVAVGAFIAAGVPLTVSLLGGNSMESVPSRLTCGVAVTACSILLQLAFLPPESYTRWIYARYGLAATR